MKLFLAVCAAAAALMSFAACTEPAVLEPTPVTPTLTTISVAVASPMLTVGQTTQATASGVDQNDASIATGSVTWTSSANASVSVDGVVTALAPGSATILASAGGKSGQTTISIVARPATALTVSNTPSATSASGAVFAVQPSVRLLNSTGGFAAQAGVAVTVATSDGAIVGGSTATTDANGIATFTGLGLSGKVGARTLTFTALGLMAATASVTITAGAPSNIAINGGNQQTVAAGASVAVAPSVVVTDADGNVVSGVPVEFTVTSGAGSITGATATTNSAGIATLGSWTPGNPGLNTLQAKVVGQSAAVAFTAMATQAPALATITVTLASSTIQAGQTTQATASGVDQYGAAIATGAVTWTSGSANATVTASGLVSGVMAGAATITASAGAKSGSAAITITAAPVVPVVTAISVSVTPTSIQIGQTAQATISAVDQFGASIAAGPVTFSISGSATITTSGVITGVSAGQAQVTAIASGKSAQTTIVITASPVVPVLTSLVMAINPTSILVGQTAQVAVSGRDQFGLPFPTGAITWLSTNSASISANGIVTGLSAGVATITANAGGFSVQGTITVTTSPSTPVLSSMSMALNPASIQVGQTTQPIVMGRDQFGGAIATGPLTWTVSGNATVSSTGLVTGVSAGNARVTATSGSVFIYGDIIVTAPPPTTPTLTSIVVTLSPGTIIGGETSQATAQGFDQYGAAIPTGPITWSLPTYASFQMSISSTGLVTSRVQYGVDPLPVYAQSGTVIGTGYLTVRAATKITGVISKRPLLIGEDADITFTAFDSNGLPIDIPLGISVNCRPAGCNGSVNLVRTSNTTVKVTGVKVGSVTVEAGTPNGPGGSIYYGVVTFDVVKPPELSSMVVTWPTNLQLGQTVTIPVAGRDQFGNPFPLGAVAYYAYPTYLASIDAFGALTVLRPGTFYVTIVGKRADGSDMPYTQAFTVPGTPTARLEVTTVPPGPIVNRVALPYNSPVTVQVVDIASGQPVAWQLLPLTATITSGGGTLTGTKTGTTNTGGFVVFNDWTFSGLAGPKVVTFTAPGVNPVTWQFTLQAASAFGITLNAGNNQTAATGASVATKPSVQVTDVDGNAVSGVAVQFTVTGGGGSITGASTVTDANGLAQVGSWILGTGTNTLKAQAANVGSTITFTATGTP